MRQTIPEPSLRGRYVRYVIPLPALIFACVLRTAPATGQAVGSEFLVNFHITNSQRSPSVASDSSGSFVVVWSSYDHDAASCGVFGQRSASAGAPLGTEFRVNTYTTSEQRGRSVASDSSGSFVVVWQSGAQDGSAYGVFGQRFGSAGA